MLDGAAGSRALPKPCHEIKSGLYSFSKNSHAEQEM
jgi:hypothetical protein